MSQDTAAYQKAYKAGYDKTHHRVSITLTKNEYKELETRAKQEGVKVTALVKNMALAFHQKHPPRSKAVEQELKELRFLIGNIATNINQIAHHSNMVREMIDHNELLSEIRKLELAVKNYVNNKSQ